LRIQRSFLDIVATGRIDREKAVVRENLRTLDRS
jgi:hypothetical protein